LKNLAMVKAVKKIVEGQCNFQFVSDLSSVMKL
jgi:hypothetical protein